MINGLQGLSLNKHKESVKVLNTKLYRLLPDILYDDLLLLVDATRAGNTSTLMYDQTESNRNGTTSSGMSYLVEQQLFRVSGGVINFSNLDLRRNFSIELWFKYNSSSNCSFFGQGTTSTNSGLHVHRYNATTIRYGMFSNDLDFTISADTTTWYQYVLTYNHSTRRKEVYVNTVYTATNVGSAYTGTGVFRLGSQYSSGSYSALNADISLMAIYSKVLSNVDVEYNYAELLRRHK